MAASQAPLRIFLIVDRREDKSRESAGQISVARRLLATSSTQRGWLSQTISAEGKDSRSPATAGNVCTISPSEPRRTTKKRLSAMRRLTDGIEQAARGVFLRIANDGYMNAEAIGSEAFWNRFRRVVGAFCMNVRSH